VVLVAGPAFTQEKLPVKEFEVVSVRAVPERTIEERMRNPAPLASATPSQVRMPYASMKDLLAGLWRFRDPDGRSRLD
jgi:hypothetical protein